MFEFEIDSVTFLFQEILQNWLMMNMSRKLLPSRALRVLLASISAVSYHVLHRACYRFNLQQVEIFCKDLVSMPE
jgi:hypothetical protein